LYKTVSSEPKLEMKLVWMVIVVVMVMMMDAVDDDDGVNILSKYFTQFCYYMFLCLKRNS